MVNPTDEALSLFRELASLTANTFQQQSILLGVSYTQQVEMLSTGIAPDYMVDLDEVASTLRNGVSSDTVYARPMTTVRTALADGRSLADALALGRQRTAAIADTDVMLAARAGVGRAMQQSSKIDYYWRHPDPGACDFCRIVSTRKYKVKNLMPVHNHCHCTAIPIAGTQSNAPVEKPDELDTEDIAVRQHGELGPVIVMSDHHFKGPSEVAG